MRLQVDKVQRLACLAITGAMTAPTRSLELLLNLIPLDIFIMMKAVRAAYTLHATNHFRLPQGRQTWSRSLRKR